MPVTTSFKDSTAVRASSSHTYSSFFPEDWCIGTVPHGGFVTSVFLSVTKAHFSTTLSAQNQPHTITLHLEFLRRTEKGDATFTVRDAKLGRQTSTIHVSLTQDIDGHTREAVVGYITNSNLDLENGVSVETDWTLQPRPPPADISKFVEDSDPNWAEVKSKPFKEFRKATQKVSFFLPRTGPNSRGSVDEWISFAANAGAVGKKEMFTNESLGYVADTWPQIIESHRDLDLHDATVDQAKRSLVARFWYPTVLLNLDIKKKLPEEGVEWLFVRASAKTIKNGRYDIEVVILDELGDVVALSHHVALCLPSSRNTAKRGARERNNPSKSNL